MNKTIAIIITAFTALCCGLPGLGLICTGALAATGSQMPEVMAESASTPQEVLIGTVMFLCLGAILLIVPFVAGFVSFKMIKPAEPVYFGENLPPAV
ncbi:MAG: hypothetical protein RBS68_12740 [Anaerolineales bacterium]|jgi:hypothetical protein|nr:hypothetical protein [Anaerolineales bacterium]